MVITTPNIININLISAILCLVLLGSHYLLIPLRKPLERSIAVKHIASGILFAFLFIHIIPELAENSETLHERLTHQGISIHLELIIYFVAMLGFLIFMGISKLKPKLIKSERKQMANIQFYARNISYVILNALVAYTMPQRISLGMDFAVLFTLIMAAHLLMIDVNIEELQHRHARFFTFVIFPAVIALGWVVAYFTEPDNITLVAILSAFVAGGIVHDIFYFEFPKRDISIRYFFHFGLGAIIGAALLILMHTFAFI